LERTYGIDLGIEIPVVFTSEDPATTLERYFRLDFDWRFVDVKLDGRAPKLTDAMRRQLQSGNVELDQLREIVPRETGPVRAVIQNRPVIMGDLAAWPDRTRSEEELIAAGARTFVCAPLHYQDKVIGTLELISPRPGDLNATHLPKLEEVLPLFSMAVQRSVE